MSCANNVFGRKMVTVDQRYIGLPSHVLKAIAASKTTGPEFDAIKQACKEAKIAYQCPGVIDEVVVHFTFPKYKAGLIIRTDTSTTYKTKILRCSKLGWNVTSVPITTLRVMSHDMIVSQFKEFAESLRRNS